jgi:hypothetical protein
MDWTVDKGWTFIKDLQIYIYMCHMITLFIAYWSLNVTTLLETFVLQHYSSCLIRLKL